MIPPIRIVEETINPNLIQIELPDYLREWYMAEAKRKDEPAAELVIRDLREYYSYRQGLDNERERLR